MKYWLVVFFVLIGSVINAQNVSGHWYGVGTVDMKYGENVYMCELIMTQKGRAVSGQFNYYFRDSLFVNKINGTFDATTRQLIINQFPVMYYRSASTLNGVDCPMMGGFMLRISKMESVLTGSLLTNDAFKYTCPTINFKLKKSEDTLSFSVETPAIAADIVTPKDSVIKPVLPPTTPIPDITPEETAKKELFDQRQKNYIKTFEISSPVVRIELYDNGAIDDDSVSLFFNNRMVLAKSKLDHRALTLTVALDSTLESNELSMFAENLGTIPPNTAAVILYDGNIRHEVVLTSDLQRNATIRLIRKKPSE